MGSLYLGQWGAEADIQQVHTSPQGRYQGIHSPPTDQTLTPNHQSAAKAGDPHSAAQWPHTPTEAPLGPLPPASCLGQSHALQHPGGGRQERC